MSSVEPSSEVPIACSLKPTLFWAASRRWISAMYSPALGSERPRPITVRSAVAISTPALGGEPGGLARLIAIEEHPQAGREPVLVMGPEVGIVDLDRDAAGLAARPRSQQRQDAVAAVNDLLGLDRD